MGKLKKRTHAELIKQITGGKPTYSLKDVMSFEDMQKYNEDAAADRLETRRKAASSLRKASQIMLNA